MGSLKSETWGVSECVKQKVLFELKYEANDFIYAEYNAADFSFAASTFAEDSSDFICAQGYITVEFLFCCSRPSLLLEQGWKFLRGHLQI